MTELETENKQRILKKRTKNSITIEIGMLLFSLGSLAIGFAGYFASHDLWVRYVFAHIGGLGIIGLFGCWAGAIAKKKGYSYRKAFFQGFVPPIMLGVISAYLAHALGAGGCGGIVSIVAAILVVLFYYLVKNKNADKQIKS